MQDVTDANFEQDVLGAVEPVVVDFWAPWCGPCHAIAPTLEQLEHEAAGRVRFVRVNVDDNVDIPTRYGVLSLPTVILFDAGEPRETIVGARPRKHFEHAFAAWLDAAA